MKSFDSETFKVRDASSYDAVTEQFSRLTEQFSRPLVSRMLTLAKVAAGEIVLDVGTGTGVVALTAAQTTDSAEAIWGIDFSEEMIAKAERNAEQSGAGQKVKFARMDAESLDFDDGKFDLVLSLFALLHFPDPLAALKEIRRVLRPGGRMVIAVGSSAPIFSTAGSTHLIKRIPEFLSDWQGKRLTAPHFLESLVKRHVPATDEPELSLLAADTHFGRSRKVTSLVREAGLEVTKTDWYGEQALIDTPEEFWEIQCTFSSVARKRLATAKAETVKELYEEFIKTSRRVQSRGGRLTYPFGAFYVAARRL